MANIGEEGYLRLLATILEYGDERGTRNSVTKSIFRRKIGI